MQLGHVFSLQVLSRLQVLLTTRNRVRILNPLSRHPNHVQLPAAKTFNLLSLDLYGKLCLSGLVLLVPRLLSQEAPLAQSCCTLIQVANSCNYCVLFVEMDT